MEKILEKLFDLKRIPTKLIFALWLSCGLLLFVPGTFLAKLKLTEFLRDYGKYIGIIFIVCSAFLFVALVSFVTKTITTRNYSKNLKNEILANLNILDFHEQALLREFFIQGKNTLQLPMDNDTVVGLVNKNIIYQASNTGFTYAHGAYFPYTISEFARKNLTYEMISLPQKPNDDERTRILETRPNWAKEKSRFENRFDSRWF